MAEFYDDVNVSNNIRVGVMAEVEEGEVVIALEDADTAPTTTPSAGGILYVESGVLKFLGSTGATVNLAEQTFIADPTTGGTVDTEARAAINAILDLLDAAGLMASS